MPTPEFFLFLILLVAPIALAFLWGDRLVSAFSARRRRTMSRRRRRATRGLPVREDAARTILDAEMSRDALEERIAETLSTFARIQTEPTLGSSDAEAVLAEVEDAVLRRESRFGDYLDCAWLQSETIELLNTEARLLREGVGLAGTPPPRAAGGHPAQTRTPEPLTGDQLGTAQGIGERLSAAAPEPVRRVESAADVDPARTVDQEPSAAARRLLDTIEAAARRKADVDQRLGSLASSRASDDQPDDSSTARPGTRIDFTVGDDA